MTRTLELGLKHIVQAFAAVSATLRCVYMFGKVDMAALWLLSAKRLVAQLGADEMSLRLSKRLEVPKVIPSMENTVS